MERGCYLSNLINILLCFILLYVPFNTQVTYAIGHTDQRIRFGDDIQDESFVLEREDKVHPASVEIFAEFIPVSEADTRKIRGVYLLNLHNNGMGINLSHITPAFLRDLNKPELSQLLDFLSKFNVKIRWEDNEGRIRSGRTPLKLKRYITIGTKDKINAASALAIVMSAKGEEDLLVKMLACASDIILNGLHNNNSSILTAKIASRVLWEMAGDLRMRESGDPPTRNEDIMLKSSDLVHFYIKYWGAKNPEYLKLYLQNMVRLISDYTNSIKGKTDLVSQNSIKVILPMKVGVILGATLSGAQSWIHEIKTSDLRKLLYLNTVSNLIWATSSFISLIGLVGAPVSAVIIPAGLGTSAVMAAALYNLRCGTPRNYNNIVQIVKGIAKTFMLETSPTMYQQALVQKALCWMQATLNVNGHSD